MGRFSGDRTVWSWYCGRDLQGAESDAILKLEREGSEAIFFDSQRESGKVIIRNGRDRWTSRWLVGDETKGANRR